MVKKLILASVIGVSLIAVPVAAHNASPGGDGPRHEFRQEVRERIDKRVDRHLGRFDGHHKRHGQMLQNSIEKFDRIVTKLKEDGKDVSKLEQLKPGLEERVNSFKAAHEEMVKAVGDIKEHDRDSEQFKLQLDAAKDERQKLREAARAVHDYWQDEIKPVIKELRGEN